MLRDMSAVTKKHFGVDIKMKIDGTLNFAASTAKALTEIKTGAPPSFDLMYQNSTSALALYKENAIVRVPWTELFPYISAKDLEYKGQVLINQTMFILPEYNTRLVKPQDVPKTWEDFLDPKWKGKLGALIYPDPWRILAGPNAWGEEKTFAYLEKLMRQNPKLGRFAEAHERVVSGETPLSWAAQRNRTLLTKQRGAPIDVAAQVEPAIIYVNILLVPKGARNANAATLIAAAMLTKEGQELQIKYYNATSMFRPNTPAGKFAAGRKFIKADLDFILKEGRRLSKKIRAIIVRRR
jgi:iron(III) transport system substrate-binding protein